ncbi:MAG: DUF2947 domain-containing protein [Oceanospirillaceae bacterium]|nr:DUF2947 domain-containing protein [Oceanospirillaceae bacterium]
MQYIPLEEYRYAWFFKHKELPINEQGLAFIKPLTETLSNQIWHQLVSNNANHPDLFHKEDWPRKQHTWTQEGQWQANWEAPGIEFPQAIEEFIEWEGNTVVYFCYCADNIIETTWDVFRQHWKNFLFLDNGPILIAKRRKEVIQFTDNGHFKLGMK